MIKFCRSVNAKYALTSLCLIISMGFATSSRALEVLTLSELVVQCKHLNSKPESIDGQYCLRYIQGFIDGAVETDVRILKDIKSSSKKGFTERAMQTRLPKRTTNSRPGQLAGFCLEDPLRLRKVVDTVVSDLVALDKGDKSKSPARIAVDDSLRRHYPCGE